MAINIHGKSYIEVKDRVAEFLRNYSNGRIVTEIVEATPEYITMRSIVTPECNQPERYFTGYAHEFRDDMTSKVNKTSMVENCETSAVGRALAFAGIGIIESIASADEVNKAVNHTATPPRPLATPGQREHIAKLTLKYGLSPEQKDFLTKRGDQLTSVEAKRIIEKLAKDVNDNIPDEPPFEDTPVTEKPNALQEKIAGSRFATKELSPEEIELEMSKND